ncbi:alpha/beta hydrolase [Undibacterium sp. SXout20W]|uniref:alpha/beta hydrolase n=1 Tax=Undibacterium sp. SXout20W TaxID=3413051 RepID=UPI003BF31638
MQPVVKYITLIGTMWLVMFGSPVAAEESMRHSTAQPEVSLLSEKLDMPGLNRQRQIRIYVPPGYATSNKRYPVLYMHDGQNLFDAATAYAGEWQVDETLNALAKSDQLEVIVVGIDNGNEKRMTELNAWDNSQFGKQEGKQYIEFIVKALKPLIDQRYRTKADRLNTAMMGSSMGGLITQYAINQYSDVFGKVGIFSPSYWAAPDIFSFLKSTPAAKDARLYLMSGGREGGGVSQAQDAGRAYASILATGHPERHIKLKIVPEGEHSEALWRSEFGPAMLWLFRPENSEN